MKLMISIALATYNGEKYIGQQLISIIEQNRTPDEIIISDDNSNDNTINIAKSILENSNIPYKIIYNTKQKGFSNNFYNSILNCSGDIIFLSDQDDFWHKDKIEKILFIFFNNPSIFLVIHDMSVSDENLSIKQSSYLDEMHSLGLSYDSHNSGCAMAFKKQLLNIALPFPKGIKNHDLWLKYCADFFNKTLIIPDILMIYRRHRQNFSSNIIVNNNPLNLIKTIIKEEKSGLHLKRILISTNSIINRIDNMEYLDLFDNNIVGKNKIKEAEELRKIISIRIETKSLPLRKRIKSILKFKSYYITKPSHLLKDIIFPLHH
jgi:glycosyltransferase involved in cell wall biosynthesis